MTCVGENIRTKSCPKPFKQVWGNSGKNLSHPQNLPCSYIHVFYQINKCFGKFIDFSLYIDKMSLRPNENGLAGRMERPTGRSLETLF